MSKSEARSERVLELAEEFLGRYRQGERPPLKEYIDRHPELAVEIKEVFPAMAMMENIAVADSSLEGDADTKPAQPAEISLKQLGDYRIIREIGHGGMGVVYEAEQVSLGRHVALKVLPSQALADAKQKRRFEREAKAAAKLHHTNIVPVFGVGEHEGLPYYVMQFIQGLGLDVVLDELNRMQAGAAHTPSGLPAGEIRISRRGDGLADVAAADVARSLLTGAFQYTEASAEEPGTPARPAFSATAEQPAADTPAPPPALSATSNASGLSDSFTVSSSSIILPGSSASTSHKSARKKLSYWLSVAHIGRQVADALEYAHKQGILHRDIKPSNLLLDLRGTVWVTDFGLAKVAGPGGDNLTHTGDILGTLRYMPPEAFEGKSDARGDVYSLGLTIYELLARRPAFSEKDRNKLIKKVTTGEPAPLHKVNRDAPRDLVTIVHKAIDRDPGRRYTTAEDLAADLQRFLDDEPIQARRQTQMERYWRFARHNPGIAILGGVLTAVLVLATLVSLVVAGRMSTLASKEAQAADDERAARHEADEAKKDADESRQRAETALQKAEENFAKARAAVNDYLTAVSEDERLKAPGLQGLRAQLLQSALKFYQQFLKERGADPTLRRELADVHYKVGEIFRELGQWQVGNRSYAEARRLYQALVAESPEDPGLQQGLARALSRTGAKDKAIAILEKLLDPKDPKYHADLGDFYNDRALGGEKDRTKQFELLRKSLAIRERLVRLRPDDAEAHLGHAGSLNNISIRLKEDRTAEALVLLQRSVAETEAAHRLRPTHLLTVRYLGIGLYNLARYAKKVGETEVALAAQRRRVEILDRRARDNPTIPGFDADLAAGYSALLRELREAGRLDEAAKTADKASTRLAEATEDATYFFNAVVGFRLAAHEVALARAKADPDGSVNTEPEAVAVVDALRQLTLSGWRRPQWLQTDPEAEALRQRADFKEQLSRMDELARADASAKLATATAEEKLAARQTILTALEALAGAPPYARFVRRNIAQARQDRAQALLELGRVAEARRALDEALLARQQLVQEAPANEQLRTDLAQSQAAAGDLFAAAGKLADAEKTWDKALATLEASLKAKPDSVPLQTTLAERLRHIATEAAKRGLWDMAAKHYRRAMALQRPTEPINWNHSALVALQTQDLSTLRAVADLAAPALETSGNIGIWRHRALTTAPNLAAAHVEAVRKLGEEMQNPWHNVAWVRALAYLRLGQADKALATVAELAPADNAWPEWQTLALIQQRLGHNKEAAAALRQADLLAEKRMQAVVAGTQLKVPLIWDEWLHNQLLRAEAHRAIHGKPMAANPYERLFRGRVLYAQGRHKEAEAEFAAAVAIRPDDADVRQTRSRLLAKLREAETLIAAAPAQGGQAGLAAEQQLARRDRKARADSLAVQAALAQIRLDTSQKKEAEAELRGVLGERAQIAAEEPDNPDYQADLASAHERLGRFLVSDGRLERGVLETQQAVALVDKFAAKSPRAARLRVNLAGNWFKIGELNWTAGRLEEGRQAWQRGMGSLKALRGAAGKGPKLARAAADLELAAGRAYADVGLWTEASDHYRRAFEADPVQGTLGDRYNHAALLVLTGQAAEYRRYCGRVHARSGNTRLDQWSARMMVLGPGALPNPRTVVSLAQGVRDTWKDEAWNIPVLALAQLRADQGRAAFATLEEFEKINKREWQFSWPFLALARHKAGKVDEARDWLRKTEDWYADQWSKHLANDGSALTKGNLFHWAFFLSLRQEAIAAVTGQPAPADAWLHLHRGRTYFKLGLPEQAESELQAAVKAQPNDRRLLFARARLYAAMGKEAEAKADRARATEKAEQTLATNPDDAAAADVVAGLLLESAESKWTPLKPLAVKSANGATLTIQPDRSVLAGGNNPDRDTFTLEVEAQGPIAAFRLETLRDPSLPSGGPGRADNGNFVLTGFRVTVHDRAIDWSRAFADYSQSDHHVTRMFDQGSSTGWGIHPNMGKSHWAVFVPARPVGGTDKVRLTILLEFQGRNERHSIGRFRVSMTGAATLMQKDDWFDAATSPRAKVAAAYLVLGDPRQAASHLTKPLALNPDAAAADFLVLAMAQARLAEHDQARTTCGLAAQRLKATGASDVLKPLLREAVLAVGPASPVAQELIAAAAGALPANLNEAVAQNPDKADGYRKRGNWYAERGRWQEAIADYAQVFRTDPNSGDAFSLGALLAYHGEMERLRKHCQAMLDQWSSTRKNSDADRTLKLILLMPDYQVDAKTLARLAAAAVSGDKNQPYYQYFLFAKGLYEFRTGQYADALATCRAIRQRSSASDPTALSLVLEAMALKRTGANAKRALGSAKAMLDRHLPGIDGFGEVWLYAHVLYREAEGLIGSETKK